MTAFSFDRWRLLAGCHWAENKKKYGLSFLAFTGLLVFWFVFVLLMDRNHHLDHTIQHGTYFISLFVIGAFFASQYFSDLGSEPKGINFLLTPASILEKLVCGLFYTVLLFFVFFTLSFYIVDVAMVALSNALKSPMEGYGKQPSEVINVFFAKMNSATSLNISYYLLLLYFAVQSFFLLGSVYYSKYPFIKTAIALFLLFLAAFLIEAYIMDAILPKGYHQISFTAFVTAGSDLDNSKTIALPEWINQVLTVLLCYAVPPLLWLVTYHRLKEKEV